MIVFTLRKVRFHIERCFRSVEYAKNVNIRFSSILNFSGKNMFILLSNAITGRGNDIFYHLDRLI
jgi:hypothetical protein